MLTEAITFHCMLISSGPLQTWFHGLVDERSHSPWTVKKTCCRSNSSVQTFSEDSFYAWQYERPSSPYRFLFAVLLVVVVMMFCLFPLAPQPIKLAVVYLSMTLLTLIFSVLTVRSILAAVTWISTGKTVWLFPHMLSDVS